MLNDDFVVEQAGQFADSVARLPTAEQVPATFQHRLSRAPSEQETAWSNELLNRQFARYRSQCDSDASARQRALRISARCCLTPASFCMSSEAQRHEPTTPPTAWIVAHALHAARSAAQLGLGFGAGSSRSARRRSCVPKSRPVATRAAGRRTSRLNPASFAAGPGRDHADAERRAGTDGAFRSQA